MLSQLASAVNRTLPLAERSAPSRLGRSSSAKYDTAVYPLNCEYIVQLSSRLTDVNHRGYIEDPAVAIQDTHDRDPTTCLSRQTSACTAVRVLQVCVRSAEQSSPAPEGFWGVACEADLPSSARPGESKSRAATACHSPFS